MRVLSVAYSLASVGVSAVGGAEQVLTLLDRALCEAGHSSFVVACTGSQTFGVLAATPAPAGMLDASERRRAIAAHRHALDDALDRWRIDVVHLHGIDFSEYLPPEGVATLVTLHMPPSWYPPEIFALTRAHMHLHCVSDTQRRHCPPHARLLPTIQNGVPVERLSCHAKKRGFALAMGRVCPEKGYHLAIDAARRANSALLLVGRVFEYATHLRYFEQEIVPRLDARRRFVGPARFDRKRQLLAQARCILLPSLAPETSSLVGMEALACGTPIVAYAAGALSEIVEHGVTGFLVSDVREMADAIDAAGTLHPDACRHAAATRFSADVMARRYLERYRQLADGDVVS